VLPQEPGHRYVPRKASQSITKHHKASQSITKHHKALQSITKHHKASQSTTPIWHYRRNYPPQPCRQAQGDQVQVRQVSRTLHGSREVRVFCLISHVFALHSLVLFALNLLVFALSMHATPNVRRTYYAHTPQPSGTCVRRMSVTIRGASCVMCVAPPSSTVTC
jgi:hypothetical protein